MNTLLHWFTSPEWAQIVKALLHSLWQGALIALALAVFMRRLANPVSRYRCSLTALACVVVAGIISWAVINSSEGRTPLPAQSQPAALNQVAPNLAVTMDASPENKIVVTANRTPAATSTRWTAWLALVWLAGAAVMLVRTGVKVAGAEKLRRSCQPLNDTRVEKLLAEARRAVGLARQVRVGVTNKLTSPAVVGVFVPMLILPLSLLTTLTPEQIHFVLLHELAHIRRGDYLANLFQFFAESLLFFNPAVWWISHQVRREREACCDALAIELSGAPVDYARTLVHVAENILQPPPVAAPAFSDKHEPSSLIDRVQRLLVPDYRPSLRLTWRAMLLSLVLGIGLLFLSAISTRVTMAAIQGETPTTSADPVKIQTASITNEVQTVMVETNVPHIEMNELFTRTFKVDPDVLLSNLRKQTGLTSTIATDEVEALRKLFSEAGADLQPTNSLFYNPKGSLFVRGTVKDLDIIEDVVQKLSYVPPQIHIGAEFVEVLANGNDIYLGSISLADSNNPASVATPPSYGNLVFPFNPSGGSPINRNPQTAKFAGILSPAQAKTMLAALKSNPNTVVVAAPEVTTLSGRQAQIQIGEVLPILKGINPLALTPPGITVTTNKVTAYLVEQMSFGTTLDLFPHLSADGYTIELTSIPKLTTFLGYDEPKTNVTIYVNGKKQTTPPPLPRFYSDQITNSAVIYDGYTLMLGGLVSEEVSKVKNKTPILGDLPLVGGAFRSESSTTTRKSVLVFITPTLIDPAGNRIHPDNETPSVQQDFPARIK